VDPKILEAIVLQLTAIQVAVTKLAETVESYTADLKEFSERFEDVVSTLENERRLDLMRDYE
jgi:predicted ATP-grasp superfamily ATP-dependent carboligase